MVDEAGDIVGEKRTGRVGVVTRVKGNKVRVLFPDEDPRRNQEMNFKKDQLYSIREKRDQPGHVREAERR